MLYSNHHYYYYCCYYYNINTTTSTTAVRTTFWTKYFVANGASGHWGRPHWGNNPFRTAVPWWGQTTYLEFDRFVPKTGPAVPTMVEALRPVLSHFSGCTHLFISTSYQVHMKGVGLLMASKPIHVFSKVTFRWGKELVKRDALEKNGVTPIIAPV